VYKGTKRPCRSTYWRIPSSGLLRRATLVRTDISEELSASIIRVTRICELWITLAVTSNRCTLRRKTKCRFLQKPHGVISRKTAFFILTAVKTSDLTSTYCFTRHWSTLHAALWSTLLHFPLTNTVWTASLLAWQVAILFALGYLREAVSILHYIGGNGRTGE
jgi:hypothetical protein